LVGALPGVASSLNHERALVRPQHIGCRLDEVTAVNKSMDTTLRAVAV